MTLIETPELDKLHEVHDHSQAIGEFLEWLSEEKGLSLCTYDSQRDRHYLARIAINTLLAEYFEIDLAKVEKEKAALLESVRESIKSARA